ncbi:hypothetical protein Tco_0424712 [Tanacetum coccineum]
MVNTGPRVDKPVWDNTKRVNHQKISKYPHLRKTFVPSGVLTRTGLITPVKQNKKRAVHTVSTARLVSTARPVSTIRPIYPRMDNVRPRGSYSPIKRSYYTKPAFRPKDLKQDVKTFGVQNMTTAGTRAVVNTGKGKMDTDLKKSRWGNPEILLQDHAVVDSGCSSHMTVNKAYLSDYEDYNRGFLAFESDPKGGKITGKGKIRTANLDFDDVYFVDELKFNLFSVSQMCDKKNSVLFTETECLILSPSFKLLHDVYSLDLKNIVPSGEHYTLSHELIPHLYSSSHSSNGSVGILRLSWNNILLSHYNSRQEIPVKDVVQDAQEKPSENASLDKDIQDSEDVIDKEGQHQMHEDGSSLARTNFEEEKRRIASQKKAAQATSTNQLSTNRPFVSTDRSFVSTDRSNTPNVSVASTSTSANADESSFVYLRGKIPIDASTLPNADLPIDLNMPDLKDASDTLPNNGIFNGAYDDDKDVGAVADFNNMDNTIAVSPIPTLRIHKDHPKGLILGSGDLLQQFITRGKIKSCSESDSSMRIGLPSGLYLEDICSIYYQVYKGKFEW